MSDEAITDLPERLKPPPATPYAWLVVGLLFVVALLNYMDRLMLASMRDPIITELKISNAGFGALTTVFLWVYAAVSPLGGYLADRIGKSRIIIFSLVAWSAATLITGFCHSFHGLLVTRALMGLSEACYIPAALALVADHHRGSTRSLATGLHMVGIYTGAALGGLGGVIAENHSWHLAFQLFGTFGIFYGVILIAFLRDAKRPETLSAERDPGGARPPSPPSSPPIATILQALFSSKAFLLLLALNILVGIANWIIYSWLPTFLKEKFSLGLGAAGMSATAYIQVASFFGVLVAASISDRWVRKNHGARALVPAIGYLAAGPCLFLAASTPIFAAAIAGLVVYGLGRGAFDANQMPLLRQIAPEEFSATGYGFLNLIGTATGGAMVYASGALLDAKIPLTVIFQACGVALTVGGGLLILIKLIHVPASTPRPAVEVTSVPPPARI